MKIKINFTDFWGGFDPWDNFITNTLKEQYEVLIVPEPDFLFYSCFGMRHMTYDCVRIFYTGENLHPDFNLCDYAIGFQNGSWGDRYLRYPLYQLVAPELEMARMKHTFEFTEALLHRKFCNFIYSNGSADPSRNMFFYLLSQYKKVDSGGGVLNNLGYRVEHKLTFQQQYKFSIAFENASAPGYTTEKIVQAFAAGTIPIYWGNPDIGQEFNTRSFVNCHDYESFEDVVRAVQEIDENDDKYLKMMKEPIEKGTVWKIEQAEDAMKNFLWKIVRQSKTEAYRRTRAATMLNYERKHRTIQRFMDNVVISLIVKAYHWRKRIIK